MKTFKYKDYKNCYFYVNSYVMDPDVIYIRIENNTYGMITDCTKFHMFTLYEKIRYGNFSDVLYHCKIKIKRLKEYYKEWYFENA